MSVFEWFTIFFKIFSGSPLVSLPNKKQSCLVNLISQ